MTRKLIIVLVTSGITLLGVILAYGPADNRSDLAEIGEIQRQIETPLISTLINRAPKLSLPPAIMPVTPTTMPVMSPSPVIIYVTVTPTPATLTHQNSTPQPSTTPIETITYMESDSTPSPTPTTQTITSHIFYTSSHWKAKYYYCDTDNGWENLSSTYLKSFSSEEELLKNYSRILHEPCKN